MNVLATDTRAAILRALCEGNSLRATARLTGTSKNTVAALLRIVGAHCKNHHDRFTRDVRCKRVQCDEIWSFVASKEKNTKPERKEEGCGDVWTWTALCQDSKLLVAYRVGDRDAPTAHEFVEDLENRLKNRVQLTTDGLKLYLTAVEAAFGWAKVDYAMLVKTYGPGPDLEANRRYSPAVCTSIQKIAIMGKPNPADVTTSHVERQNLTMRMHMRRFTRLTNAFSKKVEYHLYAVALHAMYYNYVRPHQTLKKKRNGVKRWRPGWQSARGPCTIFWTCWTAGEIVTIELDHYPRVAPLATPAARAHLPRPRGTPLPDRPSDRPSRPVPNPEHPGLRLSARNGRPPRGWLFG